MNNKQMILLFVVKQDRKFKSTHTHRATKNYDLVQQDIASQLGADFQLKFKCSFQKKTNMGVLLGNHYGKSTANGQLFGLNIETIGRQVLDGLVFSRQLIRVSCVWSTQPTWPSNIAKFNKHGPPRSFGLSAF